MAKTVKSTARALSTSARRSAAAASKASPTGNRMTDGLQNVFTGMGGEKDKTFHTFFGMTLVDRSQLDMAYRGDWIARKGIDIPAFDTFREWRTWSAEKDDVTEIENTEKKFRIQLKAMRAMVYGRLYGGGALILGVDNGAPEEELDIDTIDTDQLKFVHAVTRYELSTGPIEWDITSPYYGRPQYYAPTGTHDPKLSNTLRLHPSRVVTCLGNEIPDVNAAQGWGDPVLQAVNDAVMGAGMTNQSVSQLMAEAKLDVIKIPGLSENIVNKDYENNLRSRFSFATIAKSVFGIILLDKEEEWERIEQQFAGLPDVQKVALLIASGAFDIPATRFLSQSPAGMNATGDSDTRNYYDRLKTEQTVFVEPNLEPLDKIILRSTLGNLPDDEIRDMWYEWNPLWQLTGKEAAVLAKDKADSFKIDVDAGLINEVVLKKAREAQLIEDGTYPGLQQLIEEFDDDPELEKANAEAAMVGAPPVLDPNDPNYDPTKDPNSPDFVQPPAPQVPNAPPKQLAPPKTQPKAKTAPPSKKNSAAVDGIVRRLADATRPRSLYVHRDLLNVAELRAWAKSQGFKSTIPDMHVTLLYSKAEVDWLKIGADEFRSEPDGGLIVKPGGPRVIERFGQGAVVLAFANSDLQYRHRSMMYRGEDDGITWEWGDDYTPHVTITYDAGAIDLEQVQPYTGELRFGPEVFEEIRGFDPSGPVEKKL
jgi:phage-related protein (TIGR01555 family)